MCQEQGIVGGDQQEIAPEIIEFLPQLLLEIYTPLSRGVPYFISDTMRNDVRASVQLLMRDLSFHTPKSL